MLLKNASFYDDEILKRADIRLKDSLITEIKENLSPINNEEVVECSNLFVLPSFIDLSVTGLEGYENLKQKAFKGGWGYSMFLIAIKAALKTSWRSKTTN